MNLNFLMFVICSVVIKLENSNFVLGVSINRNNNGNSDTRERFRQCSLPTLANGVVRLRQRGKLAKFQCYRPHKLIGNTYAGCNNGKWDTPIPVCAKAGCSDVPAPENGFIITEHDDATALLFCKEGYQLVGARQTYCNGVKWDRLLGSCQETRKISQRDCNFETEDLCGWTHDDTDDFEWNRVSGHEFELRRFHTGPKHDHTNMKTNLGYYMLVESFNHLPDDKARLISPVYSSKLSKDTCFKFYYHMYGATVGNLKIYIKPESVDIMTVMQEEKYLLFEKSGNQGNKWIEEMVFIEKIDENFQIIIEGSAGTSHLNDIAVDDVALLDESQCIMNETNVTEPEEVGGVFDIQSCQNRCDETTSVSQKSNGFELITNGTGKGGLIKTCDCHDECEDLMTCCPDYRNICAFEPTRSLSEDILTETQQMETTPTIRNTTTTTTTTTTTVRPITKTPTPIITKTTTRITTLTTTTTIPKTTSTTPTPTPTTTLRASTKTTTTPTPKTIMTRTTSSTPKTTTEILDTTVIRPIYITKTPKFEDVIYKSTQMDEKKIIEIITSTMPTVYNKNTIKHEIITSTDDWINPDYYEEDDPKFISTGREIKDHEWERDFENISSSTTDPQLWVIIVLSIIITFTILGIIIFIVYYYRINYSLKNYKNKANKKYGNRHEICSDVLFLTPNEQLDFTMQRPLD